MHVLYVNVCWLDLLCVRVLCPAYVVCVCVLTGLVCVCVVLQARRARSLGAIVYCVGVKEFNETQVGPWSRSLHTQTLTCTVTCSQSLTPQLTPQKPNGDICDVPIRFFRGTEWSLFGTLYMYIIGTFIKCEWGTLWMYKCPKQAVTFSTSVNLRERYKCLRYVSWKSWHFMKKLFWVILITIRKVLIWDLILCTFRQLL